MTVENALPPLAEDPRDVQGPGATKKADEVVYRLGLHSVPVPGLPTSLRIEDVDVAFVQGPVRAQQTTMRQRHGLPVVFDKCMTRTEVGTGELLALFSISASPVPDDLSSAFDKWRARALAAAGLVTSVLDERVAGRELFEDAVLLRNGAFVGAADMRGRVRTFLPLDVNVADRAALDGLAKTSLSEGSDVARAARLYRRAALEGPTADAYAMLWVAAECFSEHRSPSRKHIERALIEAGLNPDGLPLHVGLLISLRGKVQHHGLEGDERLRTAYYEMEAVVRSLIRQAAGIRGGWWPASDNPAAFAEPFDHAVAALQPCRTTEWHRDALPDVSEPEALPLPRRVPQAALDARVDLDPALGDALEIVAGVVVDALEWQNPNATLKVYAGLPPGTPPDQVASVANATSIWLGDERLIDLDSPSAVVNLAWDLHAMVAMALIQRAGVVSEGRGIMVVEAAGAWAQYRRFVSYGDFDPGLLQLPAGEDTQSFGKLAGWAAAGDGRAKAAIRRLPRHERKPVKKLMKILHEASFGAPTEIIDLAVRTAGLKLRRYDG